MQDNWVVEGKDIPNTATHMSMIRSAHVKATQY